MIFHVGFVTRVSSFAFLINLHFPAVNIPEQIAEHMPGRVGKQCRERYLNHLDPSLRHGPWTEEEEALLLSLHARLKNQWAEIARQIPGEDLDSHPNVHVFIGGGGWMRVQGT